MLVLVLVALWLLTVEARWAERWADCEGSATAPSTPCHPSSFAAVAPSGVLQTLVGASTTNVSGERSIEKPAVAEFFLPRRTEASLRRYRPEKTRAVEGEEPLRTRLCGKVFRNLTRSERSCSSEKNERQRDRERSECWSGRSLGTQGVSSSHLISSPGDNRRLLLKAHFSLSQLLLPTGGTSDWR